MYKSMKVTYNSRRHRPGMWNMTTGKQRIYRNSEFREFKVFFRIMRVYIIMFPHIAG